MTKKRAKENVFRTRMSKWIIGMYWVILAFIIALLTYLGLYFDIGFEANSILVVSFSFVAVLFLSIIYRAYKMEFTVTDKHIRIKGVFKSHTIEKSDIKSIQKTFIPVGFRLYGASFLGGFCYIPSLGTAWVDMGNFDDGVLITTKRGKNYIITPKKPFEFIRQVKGK